MKIKRPAKVVEVCDICKRQEAYLQECNACGKEYCLMCRGIVGACWIDLGICKLCASRDDVQKVSSKYAKQITPIYEKRQAALRRLRSKKAK